MLNRKQTVLVFVLLGIAAVALVMGDWLSGALVVLLAAQTANTMFKAIDSRMPEPEPEACVPELEKRIIEREPKPESGPGYTVLNRLGTDGDEMKSTDVPNGFVIAGAKGKPVLVDYDEEGKPSKEGLEVSLQGQWLKSTTQDAMPKDLLVLVHSVKGSNQLLLKSLQANALKSDGKPVSAMELMRMGSLDGIASKIRRDYMESMKRREEHGTEQEVASSVAEGNG